MPLAIPRDELKRVTRDSWKLKKEQDLRGVSLRLQRASNSDEIALSPFELIAIAFLPSRENKTFLTISTLEARYGRAVSRRVC